MAPIKKWCFFFILTELNLINCWTSKAPTVRSSSPLSRCRRDYPTTTFSRLFLFFFYEKQRKTNDAKHMHMTQNFFRSLLSHQTFKTNNSMTLFFLNNSSTTQQITTKMHSRCDIPSDFPVSRDSEWRNPLLRVGQCTHMSVASSAPPAAISCFVQ